MIFTILLAEDNPGDIFLVRRALHVHDLSVHLIVVGDGQAAFQFIEKVEADDSCPCPDLVLLDLNLPRIPGSGVLTRIRQSNRFQLTPVIIVTSSDSPQDRELAARSGANDYFQKPGDLAGFMELGRVVRTTLEKRGRVSVAASS